ncbi:MAG: PSD1 and planctomycete cytochrome C domain-containing protein [Gemmataceae bacterium]|nr:PSD1 and planctomycete cytochrome C domain-containing protein [Gemmataceae bacterium]MCI0741097.1 PSD1 and planctomycete cytochrome C domain-containing protein [Gemmataceae bacterium]
MRRSLVSFALAFAVSGSLVAGEPKRDIKKLPASFAGAVNFQKDIEPIFARSCVPCHGPEKQRSGLRLDAGAFALQGGNSGKVIVPGQADKSRLLHLVAGLDPELRMPPLENPALSPLEVSKLRKWIDQGAQWPKSVAANDSSKSKHWSFQPIRRLQLPKVKNPGWVRNPIDAFVLAKLEKENIKPSPEAERTTLIRRLSFDLLGLPPTPDEVEAFVKDGSRDAYPKLVDRLLASPHYGERWGRHWLDLARYGDSDGYEQDRPRPFAWRYRQWVIEALNSDMPFDQFTIEQLAGDLLPKTTIAQKTATGFHRNTLTNREGGTDKEQFRVEACVDRASTTAKVYLGLTLGCAQCHDHKYDPFTQREFYQFFAFFNSDNEVDLPAPLPGEEEKYQKAKATFDTKKKELQDAVAARKKEVPAKEHKSDKQLLELNKMLADHDKKAPTLSVTPTLALGKERKTHVLLRGDFLRPGVEVKPAIPTVLDHLKPLRMPSTDNGTRSVPATLTRLDLARWLMDETNPLTPRVIANWIWHHYFGRGIVATLEDFGTQGERPSHPELLDYLASELRAPKWRLKSFHKFIVTSATYRQSSKARPELLTRDPNNTWLGRQNRLRLEAEIIRDNALAVSGLLTRTIGGPSVKPPQPAGVSELTYANTAKWVESKGADRYRRGMYTWFQRTSPHPMLTTFDAPDGVISCVRREKSNTPLQALTLLNDTIFVECAQALGKRIMTEAMGSPEERVDGAFRLCLARSPAAKEKVALVGLYHELMKAASADTKESARLLSGAPPTNVDPTEAAAWTALARTLLNLDEFMTRE